MPVDPKTLKAGTIIRHSSGVLRVLGRRKADDSGWWIAGGSGLADSVWADGAWDVPDPADPAEDPGSIADVLSQVVFRLARLEEAVETNTERLEQLVSEQSNLDTDLQNLGSLVGQLITAYQTASAKANASGVDLSAEDAQVRQIAAQISGALPAANAPAPAGSESAAPTADAASAPPADQSQPAPPAEPVAPAPTKPLYTYDGASAAAIDTSVWTPATVETQEATPRTLYTFSGDTAGGAPTGQSAEWTPYSGPTQPAAASAGA